MTFRLATLADAPKITEIYQYYVLNSNATFEITPPSTSEMQTRIADTLVNYPYIICEINGEIAGYAYASAHNIREAYQHNAILTAYLHKDFTGRQIGTFSLLKLIDLLKLQGICNVYSAVTSTNIASVKMHNKLDFCTCGQYEKTGKKFGEWIDVTWFHKRILEDAQTFVPFSKIGTNLITF